MPYLTRRRLVGTASQSRPFAAFASLAAGFGVGIWVLATIGSQVLKRPEMPGAAWWPATGLVAVVLLRSSRRHWPILLAIIAGTIFLSTRHTGSSVFSASCFAAANTLEGLITASIVRGRHIARATMLDSSRDLIRVLSAALLGVCAAAVIIAYKAQHEVGSWLPQTRGYVVSHCLGLLMFMPLLLLLPQWASLTAELRLWRINTEWLVQLGVSTGVTWIVFLHTTGLPLAFLTVFPLLWGAARLGPIRAMLSTASVSVTITVGTLNNTGPFADIANHVHRLWVFQSLLGATSCAVLSLVLSSAQRARITEKLTVREASLAEAQQLAQLGSWRWDLITNELTWSRELFTLTGLDHDGPAPGFAQLAQLVVPDDRAMVQAAVAEAAATGVGYELEYRLQRPDGEIRIIHGRGDADCDRHGKPVLLHGVAQDVTAARTLAAELAQARDLFANVLDSATQQLIIATDLDGRVTVFNVGAERILGYRAADIIGRLPVHFFDPAHIAERAAALDIPAGPGVFVHALKRGELFDTQEWTYLTSRGERVQIMLTATAMRDSTGVVTGYIGFGTDVTEQRVTERALVDSDQRFRLAFETSPVGMYLTSMDPADPGRLIRANQAMADFIGIGIDELAGLHVLDLTHESDQDTSRADLVNIATGKADTIRREKAFRHASGDIVWGQLSVSMVSSERPSEAYVIALVEDITVRKLVEAELRHQSLHDPLTGLANRTLLFDRLEHSLAASGRSLIPVGVLYIDLDGFKQVNDLSGHSAGDELLIEVAARLARVSRPGDTVSRLGGDEFAMVCPAVSDLNSLRAIADRVLQVISTEIVLSTGSHLISASIGLSLSSPESLPQEVLNHADTAMYHAKRAGKNRVGLTAA